MRTISACLCVEYHFHRLVLGNSEALTKENTPEIPSIVNRVDAIVMFIVK
ncbi:hypothetical protein QW573_24025 [Vibrio gallaecicus]|nr:hypothetical protein [Vibrio gallaecicus]MDN3617302.1 hypothetical protein [Vibrio gallaecicus]